MANDKDFIINNPIETGSTVKVNLGTVNKVLSSGTAYDVSTGLYLHTLDVSNPYNMFIKPDGTKLYRTDISSDTVIEYDLSTAWDISTASYVQDFSVTTEETVPTGLFFKTDGTKMYVTGSTSDAVKEYNLSTAWDISTASYLQDFSVAVWDGVPAAVVFNSLGTKMFVLGRTNDSIYEYSVAVAWNVLTASYVRSFSVSAQETNPVGLSFNSDGTKMYVIGTSGDAVNEYSLSVGFNLSTASYVQSFSVTSQDLNPNGVLVKGDGTAMYVSGPSGVHQYELGLYDFTLDLSTGNYFNVVGRINSLTLSNPGDIQTVQVELKTSDTLTWPTSFLWGFGATPILESSATNLLTLSTNDSGTTYAALLTAENLS